jgi:hypothetical protein
LQQYDRALFDWDRALELDDGSRRLDLHMGRAGCLVKLHRAGQLAAAVETVLSLEGVNSNTIYDCACFFALSTTLGEKSRPDRAATRAVSLLRQAIATGFVDIPHLLTDPDLKSLRQCSDYADLLWDIADMPARPTK